MPGYERLKLECDHLLSSFAFNFNLRRYGEVPQYCEISHGTCDDDPDTRGPKGHRTTVPGTSEQASCQPCGHFMYYHLHDIAGMGKNSRFEIHHNADKVNALLAEYRDGHGSADTPPADAAAGLLVPLHDDHETNMFDDAVREPDVVRFAAAQFASCSVKSNHFCADDCNAAVQSALDTCVAWTNTLHVGDYEASTAAADACITREQTAKGVCKAAAAKCVEPVMRGFYAAGLKKNSVPRKAQLMDAAAKPAAAAAAAAAGRLSDVDAATEGTAGSLGASSVADGSGVPAHIRATAHNIPGEDDASASASASAAAGETTKRTFGGVPAVAAYAAAAAAAFVVLALAAALRRRRCRTAVELAEAQVFRGERSALLGPRSDKSAAYARSYSAI